MLHSPDKAISVNLDMLRALAVTAVFVAHLCGTLQNRDFGSLGRFGVLIFFVHTSFVLMESLQRLDRGSHSAISLMSAFWIRRFFRIYPLAIFFVMLVPIFHIPPEPHVAYLWLGFKTFLSNLVLCQNLTYTNDVLGPLWSLPLEIQMYVMLPFLYLVVRGKGRYRSLALWALSVVLALTIPRISWRLNVFLYGPCFVSGVVAYDLIRSKRLTRKLPAWVWPIGTVLITALYGPHDNVSFGDKMFRAWGLSLMLGVLYAITREGKPNWLHNVFHWIAEHSYGVYLSHIVVFWIVFDRMAQFPHSAQVVVLVTGSVGIPAFLYVSIEKPLILVGINVAKRLSQKQRTGIRQHQTI